MLPTVNTITHIVQPLTREKDIRFCIQMGILNNNWIYVHCTGQVFSTKKP